jgi:hypothetical protein
MSVINLYSLFFSRLHVEHFLKSYIGIVDFVSKLVQTLT